MKIGCTKWRCLWSSSMFASKQTPPHQLYQLYYANTNAQDDADAGAQRSNLSTSTITTYLKGLPRDLTNFFNFLFVRCSSVTIPYLCWFLLIVIIEATCTSIILFHSIWFLGSIFAVNYWYWFIKSHNKWFFSFSLSLSISILHFFHHLKRFPLYCTRPILAVAIISAKHINHKWNGKHNLLWLFSLLAEILILNNSFTIQYNTTEEFMKFTSISFTIINY